MSDFLSLFHCPLRPSDFFNQTGRRLYPASPDPAVAIRILRQVLLVIVGAEVGFSIELRRLHRQSFWAAQSRNLRDDNRSTKLAAKVMLMRSTYLALGTFSCTSKSAISTSGFSSVKASQTIPSCFTCMGDQAARLFRPRLRGNLGKATSLSSTGINAVRGANYGSHGHRRHRGHGVLDRPSSETESASRLSALLQPNQLSAAPSQRASARAH